MPNPIGNLYTAGAVQFNTQPLVNLSMQLAAKRQAKQDAYNQYLQTAASRLTPAGMRTEEMPEFNDKVKKWQKIASLGGGKLALDPNLQMQEHAALQDALSTAARSKQLAENAKPLVNKMLDQKWVDESDPIKVNDVTTKFHQPSNIKDKYGNWVSNPDFQNIDYSHSLFKQPTYDSNKEWPLISKDINQVEMPGEVVPGYSSNGMVKRNYEKGYNQQGLAQIGKNAIASTDDHAKNYYETKFSNLSHDDLVKYHDIYQSVYGKGQQFVQPDGKIVDDVDLFNGTKLHAAMAIEKAMNMKQHFTKLEKDAALAQQQAMQRISANKAAYNGQGAGGSGNAFDDWPEKDFGPYKVKNDGTFINKDGTLMNGEIPVESKDIPSSIKSALSSSGIKVQDLDKGVNAVIKDGKITSISNKYIGTVTRNSMENVYQRRLDTEPQKGQRLQFSETGKPKTENTKPSSSAIAIPKGATIGKKQQ